MQPLRVEEEGIMKEVCVLVLLGWNSWTDIRKHRISLAFTLVLGTVGFFQKLWGGDYFQILEGALAGLGMMGVSLLTKGAVGMGDGLLLLALAGFLTAEEILKLLLMGLLVCASWGIVLLAARKKKRNEELPFVPFLFLGYLGGRIL